MEAVRNELKCRMLGVDTQIFDPSRPLRAGGFLTQEMGHVPFEILAIGRVDHDKNFSVRRQPLERTPNTQAYAESLLTQFDAVPLEQIGQFGMFEQDTSSNRNQLGKSPVEDRITNLTRQPRGVRESIDVDVLLIDGSPQGLPRCLISGAHSISGSPDLDATRSGEIEKVQCLFRPGRYADPPASGDISDEHCAIRHPYELIADNGFQKGRLKIGRPHRTLSTAVGYRHIVEVSEPLDHVWVSTLDDLSRLVT